MVHAPGPIWATPLLRSVATSMSPAAARAACSAMSAARCFAFMAMPPSTMSAVRKITATANTTVNTATEPLLARGGDPRNPPRIRWLGGDTPPAQPRQDQLARDQHSPNIRGPGR